MNKTAVALLLSFGASSASADTSPELAKLGERAYSHFQCSWLSQVAGDHARAEKLLGVGYDYGRRYFVALEQGRISEDDLRLSGKAMIYTIGTMPSIDFRLGWMYSGAVDSAFDVSKMSDFDRDKAIAVAEYNKKGCGSL
ncbi:hypothetical protein [Sinorhizobium fredii]